MILFPLSLLRHRVGIEFARILLLEDFERESVRQDRKNLLGPLGLVCFLIIVTTFGCVRYDSYSRSFFQLDNLDGQNTTYYHPGFIFDMTEKERRPGQRPTSSERFVRTRWPVVQREYGDVTLSHIDTYQIYTDDDQQITSDNRPRQRYRYRTRTLRHGLTIR